MDLSDFLYDLPSELIAQDPLTERSSSRLLVLDKESGRVTHGYFMDLKHYLSPGDCLVINDTKVIPARLSGVKKDSGALAEVLLLRRLENGSWQCLVRPGRKLRPGSRVVFGDGELEAEIMDVLTGGVREVRFFYEGIFEEVLDRLGEMPLPPYITHELSDRDRYQTVYARHEGSAAAPTAGLHFTNELLDEIEDMGVKIARITLHVGLGTFRPVHEEKVEDHEMHSEFYLVSEEAAALVNEALSSGHRIFAVGTTSARTLEAAALPSERYRELLSGGSVPVKRGGISMIREDDGSYAAEFSLAAGSAETSIFIYPGYRWKLTQNLITNFHLPGSTLIMLVSALAGRDHIMAAYREAIDEKYRFYSFGDAMLITDTGDQKS